MSMSILIANIDKVLTDYKSSPPKEVFYKNFARKNLCWRLFLIKSVKKWLQHMFFGEICENFLSTYFEEHLENGCFWQYFKRSYWAPPQGFFILMFINLSNFLLWAVYPSMVDSNKSWAMHLHYIWISWQGNNETIFKQYQN